MNTETKQQIRQALEDYMTAHQLSQSDVAKGSGVNAAYIIPIRKGIFTIKSGDKTIAIADKYFNRLSNYVGFSAEKTYWQTQPTQQMQDIMAVLQDNKATGEIGVIVGQTGSGKSYACRLFQKKHPNDVAIVTVGASDNIGDLLQKTIEALAIPHRVCNKACRIRMIIRHVKTMAENNQEPMIIFDEAEYMKQPALCALKELYDQLNEWCSLILIGTDQLTNNIERLKLRNKPGIPQLYRRVKFRIRRIPAIADHKLFTKGLEPGLQRWLLKNCDNYGELHDVLVPARREAERTGEPLTEDFVKMILGLV